MRLKIIIESNIIYEIFQKVRLKIIIESNIIYEIFQKVGLNIQYKTKILNALFLDWHRILVLYCIFKLKKIFIIDYYLH